MQQLSIKKITEELFRRSVPTFVGEETLPSVQSGFNKIGLLHTLPRTLLNFFGKNLKTVQFHSRRNTFGLLTHLILTLWIFFLWGYAKENVYKNNPKTVQELKAEITQFIRRIPNEMYQRIVENFAVRLNACMNQNGGNIEDFIHCTDQC